MQAGKLDRKVTIQRKVLTQSASGDEVEGWETAFQRHWAAVGPPSGRESYGEPAISALEQTEFRVRYSSIVAALNPKDRIIYPALNAGESEPQPRHVYNILAVHEIGRREGLRIVAHRHPDVIT